MAIGFPGARESGRHLLPCELGEAGTAARHELAPARIGTWRYDGATRLASWDAVTSQLFGPTPAPRTQDALTIVHANDRDRVGACLAPCLREALSQDIELRTQLPEADARWLQPIFPPLAGAGGELGTWLG